MVNTFLPVLELVDVCKSFGHPVVKKLNLVIRRGEFYALLGKNGAGKTTTLRMVSGILAPDSGSISISGFDIVDKPTFAKQILAYLPDEPCLYSKLTPIEYLEFIAGLWKLDPLISSQYASELLEMLDLGSHAHELTEGFSRGMKQKLALAGALIHRPELIVLDEPLTGLDVGAGRIVKNLLINHVKHGGTVVLTTHILEVAEQLATRIGIIKDGALIAEGSLDELRMTTDKLETLEELFLRLTAGG